MQRNNVFRKPLRFLEDVGECTIEAFDEEFPLSGKVIRRKLKSQSLIEYDAAMKYIYKVGKVPS